MASTSKCPYCGSTVSSEEKTCSHCGAPNENFVADTQRQIFLPKTIEELKEYCAERGMPLLRMRFFIGENFKEPKAFGIYKDGDNYVVYKNKADGSRAIRYDGPDEAYAVNELFQKLLSECHNRGIYPDGKENPEAVKSVKKSNRKIILTFFILGFLIAFLMAGIHGCVHRKDGYYKFDDSQLWYKYGDKWYHTSVDDPYDGWYEGYQIDHADYDDYSVGGDYSSDWGGSDFKSSTTWDSIQENNSSGSSDYSDWDSGGTDWSSDW